MLSKLLMALCAALLALCAVLWFQLGRAQEKAARLDTCRDVLNLNREISDETDDDLLRGISEP